MNIENIKKVFTEIIETSDTITDVLADGKVTFFEWPQLASEAAEIPKIIVLGKAAMAEFKEGIDTEEAIAIKEHFKSKFDIENDDLEAKIEKGVDLLERTYHFGMLGYSLYKDIAEWVISLKSTKAA